MPKETQKSKIERLEKEIEEYRRQRDIAWEKVNEYQNNADKDFFNSPHRKQLEKRIEQLEQFRKVNLDLLINADKKNKAKDKEIQKLFCEKDVPNIKNSRGAGRKPKFTEKQINEIKERRNKGETFFSLSQSYNCSIGLIHKLINENNEAHRKP